MIEVEDTSVDYDPRRNNENVVDDCLGVALRRVYKICHSRGIPFVSAFQLGEDRFYTLMALAPNCSFVIRQMASVLYPGQFMPETAAEKAARS